MKEYLKPQMEVVIVEIFCDTLLSKDTDFNDTDWD